MVIILEYNGVYVRQDIEWDNTITVIVKDVSMFQIRCWYKKGQDDQNKVEHISIRCSNCGKQTGSSIDDINTRYKDIINSFVLNTVLHHVGISWIIEANKSLKYNMDKYN